MSVYLTPAEIEKLKEQFNGFCRKSYDRLVLVIPNNKNTYTTFMEFKIRSGDSFKIIWFWDVIRHDKLDNDWSCTMDDLPNYGKPITRTEYEARLQKFTKHWKEMPKIIKEHAVKLKQIKMKEDFE